MSKIKDEKTAKELFGLKTSFGVGEDREMTRDELTASLRKPEAREAVETWVKPGYGGGARRAEDYGLVTRMTFMVYKEDLGKLRQIAYTDGKTTKQVLHEALSAYIERYEAEHGTVVPEGRAIVK